LGTYEFAAGHSMDTWVRLHDFTGEDQYSHWVAADSMKFTASVVHLPSVRNSGGWVSSIVIRNNGTSSAQVAINYYNSSGARVGYQTATIAGNGSTIKTPPSGFSGSAVVVASRDVSVVVNMPAYKSYATAGIPASETSNTVHVSEAARAYDGWYTDFTVQNAGVQATTVTATYYDRSGTPKLTLPKYLNPNGSVTFDQSASDHSALGSGFLGSAIVTSNPAVPLAVHVSKWHQSAPYFFSYTGFSSGAETLHLPTLFNQGVRRHLECLLLRQEPQFLLCPCQNRIQVYRGTQIRLHRRSLDQYFLLCLAAQLL
jgi:hypothetical protein